MFPLDEYSLLSRKVDITKHGGLIKLDMGFLSLLYLAAGAKIRI